MTVILEAYDKVCLWGWEENVGNLLLVVDGPC